MDVTFVENGPTIYVVGSSSLFGASVRRYLAHREEAWPTGDPMYPEAIAELAGRVCYMSFGRGDKPRQDYLQDQIVEKGHLSVIEHISVNLFCADVPRDVVTELTRHRVGVAYSWESTRYTDKHLRFVVPPAVRQDEELRITWNHGIRQAVATYEVMKRNSPDMPKKQRTELARTVLPGSRGMDGLVTLNLRAARHIIALRTAEGADAQMREFAYRIYQAIAPAFPAIFADAVDTDGVVTFGGGSAP